MKKITSLMLVMVLALGVMFALPFNSLAAAAPATPKISVNGGNFVGSKTVKLTCTTKNAKIYYKLGSAPDIKKDKSVASGKTVKITKTGKLYAIAVVGKQQSKVLTSKKFTITSTPATPKISVNGGTFTKAQSVKLTCATTDAKIYYKLGSKPDVKKDKYVKSGKTVSITKSGKLYAIAVAGGKKSKVLTSKKFTINTTPSKNAPPDNLNKLSKADQLKYFNKAANLVRTSKPAFHMETLRKIDDIKLSGAAAVANSIVKSVKDSLMPGNWEPEDVKKGKDNKGKFFSGNKNASDLKAADLKSISSTKSGANWKITVNIINEENPAKGTGSAQSRINCIATRQEVLDEITNISSLIKADANNATLTYHSGYATIVVNAKGQVTSAECGFQVNAQANDVKISIVKTNVTAPQSTQIKYSKFVW